MVLKDLIGIILLEDHILMVPENHTGMILEM